MSLDRIIISVFKNSWSRKMHEDSIVEEIRQYRGQHAAQFNYDLQAIYQDIKKQAKHLKS
jgi:DNA-directed RNA polymerase delta subunit